MIPRKILIITNRVPYPLKDGGNLAMKATIDGYYDAGWEVYLLSMNTSRHYVSPDVLSGLFKNLFAFEWVDINNNIKWYNILSNFLFSNKPEHVGRFYHEKFLHKITHVLDTFIPDVIQIESIFLTTYLHRMKKHSDAVTVLRLHNIEYHIWKSLFLKTENPLKKHYLKILARRMRRFEKRAWKQYDLLLPITRKDAAYVTRVYALAELEVANFGINISTIKQSNVPERWVGYHLGAMDWIPNREGIQWFVDNVWYRVKRAVPKFEFYFAGRDMPNNFKNLNVQGVYCMDEVPDAEAFIEDKKILIVPLLSGSGIRVKILEAMAHGKIVITTVNGIKGIEAKPTVHYLLASRPEDFAKWIRWCIMNKEKAEKIGTNARELIISNFDNLTITRKVINKIEEVMQNKYS